MRLLTFLCLIFMTFSTVRAQISNPDFEQSRDTAVLLPQGWNSKKTAGYTAALTAEQKYSGQQSFRIRGEASAVPSTFMPFSQIAGIKVANLKRIAVTCFVKTRDLKGSVQLWCQVWDKDNKTIGFQNSQMQSAELSGTNDWKKLTLKLTVDTGAKKLLLGGFLMGAGTAWFDSFTLEDLAGSTGESSKQVALFAKEITDIVKKHSIYTGSIDWAKADKDISELSKGVVSLEDASVISDYLISQLRKAGDNHSFVQNKVSTQKYATGNSVAEHPYSKLLDGNIGYILVPGFGSTSDTASVRFAVQIQQLIKELDQRQKITGWIVDLRKNHGGNMYPMIAGLGPLIGEGTLGYFVSSKAKPNTGSAWFYKNGSSGVNGHKNITVKQAYQPKNAKSKVAVLVGPGTASSGEMTAICFIGKPNAKLFGQPTAGYITANQSFALSTGATFNLASSYVADRNEKRYLVNIQPEVNLIKDEVSTDAELGAVKAWLKSAAP